MSSTSPIPGIHTYHCLCSTLLLATPYPLSALPRRAPPSLDHAFILPLPPLSRPSPQVATDEDRESRADELRNNEVGEFLPSLLTQNMRPARKVVVVRREDGFEKRRMYRCGRCGVGVGYEIVGLEGEGRAKERVIYLLEEGLVGTEEMDGEEGA